MGQSALRAPHLRLRKTSRRADTQRTGACAPPARGRRSRASCPCTPPRAALLRRLAPGTAAPASRPGSPPPRHWRRRPQCLQARTRLDSTREGPRWPRLRHFAIAPHRPPHQALPPHCRPAGARRWSPPGWTATRWALQRRIAGRRPRPPRPQILASTTANLRKPPACHDAHDVALPQAVQKSSDRTAQAHTTATKSSQRKRCGQACESAEQRGAP